MSCLVVTFYSYKGGVGRSFALANVAVTLAQWGFRVLAVDWDIEAPGLDHYFGQFRAAPTPGVIDFIHDCLAGRVRLAKSYQSRINIPGAAGELTLMPAAGEIDQTDYTKAVQALNWDELFLSFGLGQRLEEMRSEWLRQFDFVLVDSRTGVTDFSGITTVQLPDVLAFQFTANKQSLRGCCDVVRRAKEARYQLPVDRATLLTMPIPSRFELREEYDRANFWRQEFARELTPFFSEWVPKSMEPIRMVDVLSIPHVPRWTFGEELAVLEEPAGRQGIRGSNFPVTYALETISAVIANRFDRVDLLCSSRDEYVLTAREMGRASEKRSESTLDAVVEKPRVFVSYNRQDEKFAKLVRDALSEFGADVYPFDFDVTAPQRFDAVIGKAIEDVDILMVLIGSKFEKYQMIETELFMRSSLRSSGTRRRSVIPIMVPGTSREDVPPILADRNLYRIAPEVPFGPQLSEILGQLLGHSLPNKSDQANVYVYHHSKEVYVYHSKQDEDYAILLKQALEEREVEVALPGALGSDTELRAYHLKRLRECDAVAVCWAHASEVWVRTAMDELRDWRALDRREPFIFRALVIGPPPDRRKRQAMNVFPRGAFDLLIDLEDQDLLPELLDSLVPIP